MYSFDDIDKLADTLGIPSEKSKDQPFSSSTIYIGFLWDIVGKRVFLSPRKVEKYLAVIQAWLTRATHVLQDIRKLYGKLLHACSAMPRGRAYLTGFEHMLATCGKKPFMPHHPDKAISNDLAWWIKALHTGAVSCPILPSSPFINPQAFSDASSGVGIGIGIVIGLYWHAWRLLPGWCNRESPKDIGWVEAVGFELLVRALAGMGIIQDWTIVHGDNTGVIEGWRSNHHRNRATNFIFRRIHLFLHSLPNHVIIGTRYVQSQFNPANDPSQGILGPMETLIPHFQIPTKLDTFIIDALAPPSPTELIALQLGQYSTPAVKVINRARLHAEELE